MYLADTSVWVDYIQGRGTAAVQLLENCCKTPLPRPISYHIYMEILQGAGSDSAFDRLQRYFSGQRFCGFENPQTSHGKAARIYYDCRRAGLTVRSSVDCLIAQCALEKELELLHQDRDYINMQPLVPGLAQKHFLG
ncbi:MAG: hypothetical protein DRR42_03680 [Gammaproteobacteria bacterium]|nr:MAG: hypothetical protein DRR42_03680 [Gammaproteobacteria bacterium]